MNIVVVGAGPAGLAAACSAAESGASVILIDDNSQPGGQIWRGTKGLLVDRLSHTSARVLTGSRVFFAERTQLFVESPAGIATVPFDKLILATGSRELFLPFPGWTLPGVTGAGGLQALVKSGLPIAGKRIVIAGTGPLLLAVAAHLSSKPGARVVAIAEQASWSKLLRFGTTLPFSKAREALHLWHPTYSPGTWVTHAHGHEHVESVTLQSGSRVSTFPCDYLAVGYGLIPNDELLQVLGCDTVPVNDYQQTADAKVYAAGEVTGIGGVDLSIVEGSIAGYAAAGNLDRARTLWRARDRWKRFAQRLAKTFELRPEIKSLAKPETLICRCEDVALGRLQPYNSWREAKLQTRCGMGACQGRVCGPITEHLLGWRPGSVRPPIFPSSVSSFVIQEGTSL